MSENQWESPRREWNQYTTTWCVSTNGVWSRSSAYLGNEPLAPEWFLSGQLLAGLSRIQFQKESHPCDRKRTMEPASCRRPRFRWSYDLLPAGGHLSSWALLLALVSLLSLFLPCNPTVTVDELGIAAEEWVQILRKYCIYTFCNIYLCTGCICTKLILFRKIISRENPEICTLLIVV